jgi:hypothetical protein
LEEINHQDAKTRDSIRRKALPRPIVLLVQRRDPQQNISPWTHKYTSRIRNRVQAGLIWNTRMHQHSKVKSVYLLMITLWKEDVVINR